MSFHETTFEGLRSVEFQTSFCRVVIVTEVGPRISFFGTHTGRNLLFWDSEQRLQRNDWFLRGGHRIWVTRPNADETEEAYAADNQACKVKSTDTEICATGPANDTFGLQKEMIVSCSTENSFTIVNCIRNVSDMLWSGGVWSLTATAPGEYSVYGIPLGDGSKWDTFSVVIPKKWGGVHESKVNDPQLSFTENCLVVRPRGAESKRMIQAPQGIIGMTDTAEKISFIKRSHYDPSAVYPFNTNVAYYIAPGNVMVEMEFMGGQRMLKPGEELRLVETWELTDPVIWEKI